MQPYLHINPAVHSMEVSASTVVFIIFSALCHLCLLSHLDGPTWSSTVRVWLFADTGSASFMESVYQVLHDSYESTWFSFLMIWCINWFFLLQINNVFLKWTQTGYHIVLSLCVTVGFSYILLWWIWKWDWPTNFSIMTFSDFCVRTMQASWNDLGTVPVSLDLEEFV